MFQQLLARITDDDNPRLHRIPFMLMWIASYAFAWFALIATITVLIEMNLITTSHSLSLYPKDTTWIERLATGLSLGLPLSLIQTWLIRRRYGFVPRFWRYATILGAIIAGWVIPIASLNFINNSMWIDLIIWFVSLNLLQMVALLGLNRKAWLIGFVGIIAGMLAAIIGLLDVAD